MENPNRVIIAGAGASGLMAAITAARNGAKVTVLEAMERPGKKLLTTGNGRCNLTNMDPELAKRYHGAPEMFTRPVIERFDAGAVRAFFLKLGLLTTEKNGYVYPYTNQASSVLEVLLTELRRLKIKLKLMEKIEAIRHEDSIWKVQTGTWTYRAERLVLSCGSKCAPMTGSDGSGYQLAEMAGLNLIPVVPALTPLLCEGKAPALAAGVRGMAEISLWKCRKQDMGQMPAKKQGRKDRGRKSAKVGDWIFVASEQGEVQWTKYGISGIAVFQLSRYVAAAKETAAFQATLDLLKPYLEESKMGRKTLEKMLWQRAGQISSDPAGALLRGILNEKLIPLMLDRAEIRPKTRCRDLTEKELCALLDVCSCYPLTVSGTKSYDVCQACAGGVDTAQISPETMECKHIPGLYVTGELLDVDGPCGGYNLQWAWASGYVAGQSAAS